MAGQFVVARNPDPASSLRYLLRVPLPGGDVLLKAREVWPRAAKVYCHRAESWPAWADIVETVPVRSCLRRGAAIDLVLDRQRENRSQFVLTHVRGGREAIFWQTARTAKQARPGVDLPSARAAGTADLEIVVDSHERYPYTFGAQQVGTRRQALPAGDYGIVHDGRLLAAVERKSLDDLVSTLTSGKLKYVLGELAALPRAGLVVEERWSAVFKLERVRPSVVAEGLAEAQVRWPQVPIVFCETRPLAQEWTFRFLGAARAAMLEDEHAMGRLAALPRVEERGPPRSALIRSWARARGLAVSDRGRVPGSVVAAYEADQGPAPG